MVSYWDNNQILRYASVDFLQYFNGSLENVIGTLTLKKLLGVVYKSHIPYLKSVLSGNTEVFEKEIYNNFNELVLCVFTYYPEKKDNQLQGFYLQVFEKNSMILSDADLVTDINKFNTILANSTQTDQNDEGQILDLQIEKVVEYLKTILTSKFPGLSHIAELHFMSVSKLKRDFKNACGVSPFIYFRKLQMALAEQYLKEKKYRIGELAEIFNFSNPSNFTACYKRFKKSTDSKFD